MQFDPAVGAEIRKSRPAVVCNVDSIGRLPLRVIVPLTDWQASFEKVPWMVFVPSSTSTGLLKDSAADAFQVKSVSVTRFGRRIGVIDATQMDRVTAAIALCVGAP